MRTPRLSLAPVALVAFAAAAVAVYVHVDSARLLTHTVGVFALLAELLRHGVLYPAEPSTDLVYSVFYHPLAFAPYALLPGSGLDLIASMRALVGVETLLCALVLAWLAKPALGPTRWLPALCAFCTLPVCFSLIGMRDDPRASLCALLALVAYGGSEVRDGQRPPSRAALAAACLTLAFFVKATAVLAPAAALLWAAVREGGREGAGRRVLRLVAAGAGFVTAGIVFVQVGLGCDFLGNGLYYLVVEPAREPRPWGAAVAALGRDLCGQPGSGHPLDLASPAILAASALVIVARWRRGACDRYDVLVAAALCKTVVAYRSWGTDLNHLLDLTLVCALHANRALGAWLTPARALSIFAIALGLGQPWRRLVPEANTPTLENSPLATVAKGMRTLPPATTLCEEPFLAWLTESRPLVTDPFLTFATLRRAPGIRERWFGPKEDPAAVHRLVLMHDPMADDARIEHWYRHLHFDAEFLAMVRRDWEVKIRTDTATVLARKQ